MKDSEKMKLMTITPSEAEFYKSCAINAMQGILEQGGKLGTLAEFVPGEVAKRAFVFADAMINEYRKRFTEIKEG